MSIKHIENLPLEELILVITNFSDYTFTEKVDGVNLILGRNKNGYLYTSRAGKGGKPVTHTKEYPTVPANSAIANAHTALTNHPQILNCNALKPGMEVECEVLFGPQPNGIVYGSNRIVFLRGLGETPQSVVDALVNIKHSAWDVWNLTSSDGKTIKEQSFRTFWYYDGVPTIDSNIMEPTDELWDLLAAAEKWLDKTDINDRMSNRDWLRLNLSTIPMSERETYKQFRELARHNEKHIAKKIKKLLVVPLSTITPKFRDREVSSMEDLGIEGVVLRHTETGQQYKIVDRERFTALNAFNHYIRNEGIRRGSWGRIPKQCHTRLPEYHTSVYDQYLQAMCIPQLDDWMSVKRGVAKYAGETLDDTINNLVKTILQTCVIEYRHSVCFSIMKALDLLDERLNEYIRNGSGYFIYTDDHRVGYTRAVHNRTMLMFAESHIDLTNTLNKVRVATTFEEIIGIVFAKQLAALH